MKYEEFLSAVHAVILLTGTIAPPAVNAASEEETETFLAEITSITETSQEVTTTAADTEVTPEGASTSEVSITPTKTEQNSIESAPTFENQGDLLDVPSTVVTVALAPSIAGKTEYCANESLYIFDTSFWGKIAAVPLTHGTGIFGTVTKD